MKDNTKHKDKLSNKGKAIIFATAAVSLPLVAYGFISGNKGFLDLGTLVLIVSGMYLVSTGRKGDSK